MKRHSRFSYVQARLQARHGERPSEAEWKQLASIASAARFLQTARKGPLRRWLLELGPDCGIHEMEQTLRRHWRDHVLEVAGWAPADWRPAITWSRHLPDLPTLWHLLRGHPAPRWVGNDPELKSLTATSPGQRRRVLAGSERAPLLEGTGEERPTVIVGAWYRHWRTLWPETDSLTAKHLREIAQAVARGRTPHFEQTGGPPAMEELEKQLTRLFRRFAHEPAAVFAHLALTALLLERLRGALAVRILFPPPSGEEA